MCIGEPTSDLKPVLGLGEVHVWIGRTQISEPLLQALERTLGDDERIRAGKFRFQTDRCRYIAAHGILRNIVGRYLEVGPSDVSFTENAFGKPFLRPDGGGENLFFNISHSGDLVVVALARKRQIGVDVELVRALPDFDSIAEGHFAPPERALLTAAEPERRQQTFFACWTRKEAYIKAVGQGLSMQLDAFDTCMPHGCPGRRLEGSGEPAGVESWWLADLTVPTGYQGAVVVEGELERLSYCNWRP